MPVASQSSYLQTAYHFALSSALTTSEQHTVSELLALLSVDYVKEVSSMVLEDDSSSKFNDDQATNNRLIIKKLVDGRGLACPMPLLKTKVALREVNAGEALYVIATDPNSKADITSFCQQSQNQSSPPDSQSEKLNLLINETSSSVKPSDNNSDSSDNNSNNNAARAVDNEKTADNSTTNHRNTKPVDTIFHFIITKTDSN